MPRPGQRRCGVWLAIVSAVLLVGCASTRGNVAVARATAPVAPAPDLAALRAATYTGIESDPVTLVDGRWEGEPYAPGAASRPSVWLVPDFVLDADLDGDARQDAVVLLGQSSGGTGANLYLAVVGRRDRAVENLATTLIGDRVQVREASVRGDRIVLAVVQAGPGDSMCCPSELATRTWTFDAGRLREEKPTVTGKLGVQALTGKLWVLRSFGRSTPAPDTPEVTLVAEAGRVSGTSGCNRYFAQAKDGATPGEIEIGPIAGTRMACPEPQMTVEQRYLDALGHARKLSFLAGRLAITYDVGGHLDVLVFEGRALPTGE